MGMQDRVHSLISVAALLLIYLGASALWGVGAGLLGVGALLLAGVIYARTRR